MVGSISTMIDGPIRKRSAIRQLEDLSFRSGSFSFATRATPPTIRYRRRCPEAAQRTGDSVGNGCRGNWLRNEKETRRWKRGREEESDRRGEDEDLTGKREGMGRGK